MAGNVLNSVFKSEIKDGGKFNLKKNEREVVISLPVKSKIWKMIFSIEHYKIIVTQLFNVKYF